MKVVLLGAKGMLGFDLKEALADYELFAFDKDDFDIRDSKRANNCINRIKPDVVINSAAYTDVDDCETNKKLSFNVNGYAVGNLAKICNKINARLIHISTDYVFDGKNKKGYMESSNPSPINTYGKSKLLGEILLKKNAKKYFLIRTSWLYGKNGENFVNNILDKAKRVNILHVVNDQSGCPTYTKDLAEKISSIFVASKNYGTYHITNSGHCSWFEFAGEILKIAKIKKKIIPISSSEINRPALRPKVSILLNTKVAPLRNWREALKEYLCDL